MSMKMKSRLADKRQPLSLSVYLVGGAVVLIGLIAVILAVASGNGESASEPPDYSGVPSAWQNRNSLGDPEAPVTVQAWEDFRCPACAAFNQRVKPGLVDNYIVSGKVKLEFHHFPLQQHEPGASLAAQASECAADQGQFWPYHDLLYENQGTLGEPGIFLNFARSLDLDPIAFNNCLVEQQPIESIAADFRDAQSLGIRGTPAFFINGRPLLGAREFEAFARIIDEELEAAGQAVDGAAG